MIIGADELILWLRKNNHTLEPNERLGKEIRKIIEGDNIGGKLIERNKHSYWGNEKNANRFNLPKTSAQYEISINKATTLFQTLENRYIAI